MKVLFTFDEISRIEATAQALLSPLAFPEADQWRDVVLERVTELFDTDRALFAVAMPGIENANRLYGADQSVIEPYLTYYHDIDPTTQIVPRIEDGIVCGALAASLAPAGWTSFLGSEVYSDYYRPLGVQDHVAVWVEPALDPRRLIVNDAAAGLAIYRGRRGAELFGDKGMAIMRLLRPALLGGLEALHAFARQRASLERTVDLMPEAVRLCSAAGAVLHQNDAMRHLLAFDPERDRLEAALRSAVHSLGTLSRGRRRHVAETPLPPVLPSVRTERAWYRVRGSLLAIGTGTREPGIVLMLQRYGPEALSSELLQEQFGLTRRQARVALLLAERRRNSEIAQILSISPHTARRHTDSVLLKLGVHSRDAVLDTILRRISPPKD